MPDRPGSQADCDDLPDCLAPQHMPRAGQMVVALDVGALDGVQLHYWVARVLGWRFMALPPQPACAQDRGASFCHWLVLRPDGKPAGSVRVPQGVLPSQAASMPDWAHDEAALGRVLDARRIGVQPHESGGWLAWCEGARATASLVADTRALAALRALVGCELGPLVPDLSALAAHADGLMAVDCAIERLLAQARGMLMH